jgi:hypothetical protein
VNSASEVDVGFRLRTEVLARILGADDARLYVSRGSKSELWPVSVFLKDPLKYGAKDFRKDFSNLVTSPNLGAVWSQNSRYTAPSLSNPHDTVGVLVTWPGVRAGLEYFNGVNSAGQGNRPFTQGTYLTGFYYYGDPLGEATGGEAVTTTAKLELDLSSRFTCATWIVRGFRPFRDNLADWLLDHPGQTPGKDRFTGLQETLSWKLASSTTLTMGTAWQREEAVLNVAGMCRNGFSWFGDLTFRWPARS